MKSGFYKQIHGWHIDKCADQSFRGMGYQCPYPSRYADGGWGYV